MQRKESRPEEMGRKFQQVVELNFVDHTSDNTIGRVRKKKTSSSLIPNSNGSSRCR
jgi:hypothetical protein